MVEEALDEIAALVEMAIKETGVFIQNCLI
jgi:hypothetical protein